MSLYAAKISKVWAWTLLKSIHAAQQKCFWICHEALQAEFHILNADNQIGDQLFPDNIRFMPDQRTREKLNDQTRLRGEKGCI